MTGAEARAIFLELFGSKAPTASACRALGCRSRRTIQQLCKRETVPTIWALAIKQLRRERMLISYFDAVRSLKAEARAISTKEPPCP